MRLKFPNHYHLYITSAGYHGKSTIKKIPSDIIAHKLLGFNLYQLHLVENNTSKYFIFLSVFIGENKILQFLSMAKPHPS